MIENITRQFAKDAGLMSMEDALKKALSKVEVETLSRTLELIKNEYDGFCDDPILDEFMDVITSILSKNHSELDQDKQ